ncbi:hypothetical protein FRC05_010018, partial [Tulasnella sp. 425]
KAVLEKENEALKAELAARDAEVLRLQHLNTQAQQDARGGTRLIPRPPGERGKNGWNLQEHMGLTSDPKTYHNIRRCVRYAIYKTQLDIWLRINRQDEKSLFACYTLVKQRFPKMAQFEGNWATREFVKGICQNARKHCRRKGINCPTLPAELLDNDGNGGDDDDGSDDGNNGGNEDGNEDGNDGNDGNDDDDDGNDSGDDNGSNGVGGDGEVDEGHDVGDVRGPHKTITTGSSRKSTKGKTSASVLKPKSRNDDEELEQDESGGEGEGQDEGEGEVDDEDEDEEAGDGEGHGYGEDGEPDEDFDMYPGGGDEELGEDEGGWDYSAD